MSNETKKEEQLEVLKTRRIFNNIVDKDNLRIVQSRTLQILSDALSKSFGPYGSNSVITKLHGNGLAPNHYTKDGHTILKSIIFQDVIEMSTKESIEEITQSIVTKVGDGTTSAVLLSSIIFDALTELEAEDKIPYEIIEDFNAAVENITEEIMKNKKEFTPQDAYDITHVSTNGNDELSKQIGDLYEKYGTDVHIELGTSPNNDTIISEYDGIVHHDGYMDSRFINNIEKGIGEQTNPEIYVYLDPIDNNVIGSTFINILTENIVKNFDTTTRYVNMKGIIPTVIVAPVISIDFQSYIDSIMKLFSEVGLASELLIVTGVTRDESLEDIATITGAKTIKKYIDPEKYAEDVKKGLAADKDNFKMFAGTAELVKADRAKTIFVNPKNQFDDSGNESKIYKKLVESIRLELANAELESSTMTEVYRLRKRLRSLTTSNIEYLVGGIAQSDRENTRDLLDDAVKNCKSAAEHGYGQGSNVEGLIAAYKLVNNNSDMSEDIRRMHTIIADAYKQVIEILLNVSGIIDRGEVDNIIGSIIDEGVAYNVRTKSLDGKVKTSIMSDPNILDAISKIVTRMVTANQFICPDINFNRYMG